MVAYAPAAPAPPAPSPAATSVPDASGTATATATPGPGGGGGGEEAQDVLICESLPGGPRELRIKGSEWPRYQDRAARGPCPAGGAPAVVRALSPATVPVTAGTLPAGPPASGTVVPMRLERAGRVRVTLLGARTSWCDGDLLLLAPPLSPTPAPGTADGTLPAGARRLWSSYLRHVGDAVELGPYPAGTTLVLGLSPWGACTPPSGSPWPSDGERARVAPTGAVGTWDVWWEDLRLDTADYDDLVVRVEVLPTGP
jgi:hypothetical protein